MKQSPYNALPDRAFWRRAMSQATPEDFDPVAGEVPFRIGPADKVATAGSCFAQHISRTLVAQGFNYLVTEAGPVSAGARDEGYGVFPARFGNVYTVRQLLQLFDRAYGLFHPAEQAWRHPEGFLVDPFRPRVQARGFDSRADLVQDRQAHLGAVRAMFDRCNVFVFTLGLTEAWVSTRDGAVYPLAPGVAGGRFDAERHAYHNFRVDEMVADLNAFIGKLRRVNPSVRIMLTVSPVALMATCEPRHVLLATTYSKSALRVVAETIAGAHEQVAYFPSYEIILGPQARGRFLAEDMREVTSEGVATVMRCFARNYLDSAAPVAESHARRVASADADARARFEELDRVVCDEEAIDG